MKEAVLSAKTLGTARKRFEIIVKVIKKNPPPPPPKFKKKILCRAFFTFSELVRFSRSGSHITIAFQGGGGGGGEGGMTWNEEPWWLW